MEFKNITPLTVLLGPNGSGRSTIFDVFTFLAECFESGLRRAWDRRGRAKELKTRGSDGPVVIEIKYREPGFPIITDRLAVDERKGGPVVVEEWLQWKRGSHGRPFRFLNYKEEHGRAISGALPDEEDTRSEISLKSADLIAVNALGQFADHLRTRTLAAAVIWQVANCIAIEELEAWLFGEWQAVEDAYPRVSHTIPRQQQYRERDGMVGGTWEAFERALQRAGYFKSGLRKAEAARMIGKYINPARNSSRSFRVLRDVVLEATA